MGQRAGYHHSPEARIRMGASHLGLEPYEYAAHLDAGEKWCWGHAAWEPVSEFGPHARTRIRLDTQCRESSRARAREYQRRKQRRKRAKP